MNFVAFNFAPFWGAMLTSAVLAYPIYRLLLKLKSRQTVSQFAPEGHQAKQGTPTMGGLIIVVGILAGFLISSVTGTPFRAAGGSYETIPPGLHGGSLLAVLILLLGFAFIGFVDDFVVPRLIKGKRGLGWKQKIAMQIFFAVLATGALLGFAIAPQAAVYVFLILFCANAYNFLDGLDALAGSVLIALCGGLVVMANFYPGTNLPVICQVLIGATIPFLFMNAPPAKIFMGDVGSLPIGALLGFVMSSLLYAGGRSIQTLYSGAPQNSYVFAPSTVVPLLVIGFVLIAELIPVPLQIFWVKVFKRKLFIYTPIHHAFEKKGWKETRVVWSFLLAQIVLCALAVSFTTPWHAEGATLSSGSSEDSAAR